MLFNEVTFLNQIFESNILNFDELAIRLFRHQYEHNNNYRHYCQYIQVTPSKVKVAADIPFLPVQFFKTQEVKTGNFEPEAIFTSSTSTGSIPSKHFVKEVSIYERSFKKAFNLFYGNPEQYAILALLPSYLEREGSSLILMAEQLIQQSGRPQSGFYLHNFEALRETVQSLKAQHISTLLLGVTFALLDFADQFPVQMPELIIMETGGMKGKRKEMVRNEVHEILTEKFKVNTIHSEYGMTELLSQAYSKGEGIFYCPPWMQVILSDPNDPLQPLPLGKTGRINIIDLANIHSCAFIQTSDIGKSFADGSFEVLGRLDQSDIRGCSLMYL
jgi:phenylacetate-coenzyme A ligase PaaK-like adenylate-forming protein